MAPFTLNERRVSWKVIIIGNYMVDVGVQLSADIWKYVDCDGLRMFAPEFFNGFIHLLAALWAL